MDLRQRGDEVVLLGLRAGSARHVGPAATLATDHVAVVVVGTAVIAVAHAAAVLRLRQAKGLRHTLITVLAGDEALALALAGAHHAAGIVDRSQDVAGAGLAALGIVGLEIPVAILALVTATSLHEGLAVTGPGHGSVLGIIDRVTDTIVQRALRVAVTGLADLIRSDVLLGIAVEEGHALLAVLALRVVHAVVADAAGDMAGGHEDGLVEVTADGVLVALALLAGIRLLAEGRLPGQIVEEVLAELTVQALGVVGALAAPVHHAVLVVLGHEGGIQGQALRGMAVAGAGTSHHHV